MISNFRTNVIVSRNTTSSWQKIIGHSWQEILWIHKLVVIECIHVLGWQLITGALVGLENKDMFSVEA
jgi:hypothetical protein